jgi:hypothetical protein
VQLAAAVLSEQHDEWAVVRRYLTVAWLLTPTAAIACGRR